MRIGHKSFIAEAGGGKNETGRNGVMHFNVKHPTVIERKISHYIRRQVIVSTRHLVERHFINKPCKNFVVQKLYESGACTIKILTTVIYSVS